MIRIVGVLALLVIGVAIWMVIVQGRFEDVPKTQSLPGGFKSRLLAMEFVSNTSDVDTILGPNVPHNREIMQRVLMIDFIWIVCYGLLFASISALLMRRRCPWARYLGFVALIAGVAAAVFDFRENRRILEVMSQVPYEQNVVNRLNDAALLKWTFSFVAIALLAIAFQDLANRFAKWISISFILTALIGFAGLWHYPLLRFIALPLLSGLLLLTLTAFFWPEKLKENAC